MEFAASHSTWLWRHRVGICLSLILLFGAVLRVQYALPRLDQSRFWDERYNFKNLRKVVETWSFEPGSIYYPSPLQTWPQALAVAGSQWLYEEYGVESARTVLPRGRFTSTAYLLVRMISVLYGTLTLAILFLVGRLLVSSGVGLAAALALAAMPWHIHVSSKFKPDALLVLGVVLGFHWSLLAIERARARDSILAGLGICVAMSAKVMGGLVSLPLVVGTLVVGWQDRRRIALLALAAGSSLVMFLLLNPYARYYLQWVAHLQGDYAMRAEWVEMTRASMPVELAGYLFGPYVHGPIFATLAVIGLVWLASSLGRSPGLTPVKRAHRAMLVVFPPIYAGAYLISTPYFKGNNLLPIVPFTTLAGLWLIWAIARWLGRRAPLLGDGAVKALAASLLIVLLGYQGILYVYQSLTPTTLDRALEFVSRGGRPRHTRVLFTEVIATPTAWAMKRQHSKGAPGLIHVERLEGIDPRRLALSDGEIFLEERLESEGTDLYRLRVGSVAEDGVRTIRPRLFELRGPPLVAIRHPRRLAGKILPVEMTPCRPLVEACYQGTLPAAIEPGRLVTLVISVPRGIIRWTQEAPPVHVAGREIALIEVTRTRRRVILVTERFIPGEVAASVRFATGQPHQRGVTIGVEVGRWRRQG